MKKLLFISTRKEFEKVRLYKDEGLLPYYLGKEYKLEVDFLCSNIKKWMPEYFRNIKIIEKKTYLQVFNKNKIMNNLFLDYILYIIKYSKKYDYLQFFQIHAAKSLLIFLYKLLNPKGKVYLKLDIELKSIEQFNNENMIKKFCHRYMLKNIDLFSCETKECYQKILHNNILGINISKKIAYIPNGFDEEYLKENNIKIKSFEEKENVMITVGRIGTEQKNNEMLLESLNNIDLKNWKIYIIGPYTEEFKIKYEKFIKNNQDKKESVILTGNIENKNLLYDYYNKAKVFLLTSRWGSFEIVLSEALRFGDYIITTNVGTATEITDNRKIGVVTEIENIIQFKNEVLKIIDNKINLEEKYNKSLELSKRQFLWNEIVKDKKLKEFFGAEGNE